MLTCNTHTHTDTHTHTHTHTHTQIVVLDKDEVGVVGPVQREVERVFGTRDVFRHTRILADHHPPFVGFAVKVRTVRSGTLTRILAFVALSIVFAVQIWTIVGEGGVPSALGVVFVASCNAGKKEHLVSSFDG